MSDMSKEYTLSTNKQILETNKKKHNTKQNKS